MATDTRVRPKSPKLPLEADERGQLRRCGLRLADLATLTADEVARRTGWPLSRCRQLCALALFQQIPGIGPASAGDLVLLDIWSLDDLRHQHARDLFERLQVLTNSQQDPCVEDVFAYLVHYANDPVAGEAKPWWIWSRERLASRAATR